VNPQICLDHFFLLFFSFIKTRKTAPFKQCNQSCGASLLMPRNNVQGSKYLSKTDDKTTQKHTRHKSFMFCMYDGTKILFKSSLSIR